MAFTHMRISAVARENAMAVVDRLMDAKLKFSVLADPETGWIILARVDYLKEHEMRELAQTIVDDRLGQPRLEDRGQEEQCR